MKIKNTNSETSFPWPDDTFIQGREARDGLQAFIEVCPPGGGSFFRVDDHTLVHAEARAWEKYQTFTHCFDGSGEHGPFDPRRYENGSGYCTKCGIWMSDVLEPSQKWRAERDACAAMKDVYGRKIISSPWWPPGVRYFTAALLAAWNDTEPPEPIELPTKEEFAAWCGDDGDVEFTDEDLGEVLTRMAAAVRTPVDNEGESS